MKALWGYRRAESPEEFLQVAPAWACEEKILSKNNRLYGALEPTHLRLQLCSLCQNVTDVWSCPKKND